jgi:hypothetical protein
VHELQDDAPPLEYVPVTGIKGNNNKYPRGHQLIKPAKQSDAVFPPPRHWLPAGHDEQEEALAAEVVPVIIKKER